MKSAIIELVLVVLMCGLAAGYTQDSFTGGNGTVRVNLLSNQTANASFSIPLFANASSASVNISYSSTVNRTYDNFDRADSATVGGNWTEYDETTYSYFIIEDNHLRYRHYDPRRPFITTEIGDVSDAYEINITFDMHLNTTYYMDFELFNNGTDNSSGMSIRIARDGGRKFYLVHYDTEVASYPIPEFIENKTWRFIINYNYTHFRIKDYDASGDAPEPENYNWTVEHNWTDSRANTYFAIRGGGGTDVFTNIDNFSVTVGSRISTINVTMQDAVLFHGQVHEGPVLNASFAGPINQVLSGGCVCEGCSLASSVCNMPMFFHSEMQSVMGGSDLEINYSHQVNIYEEKTRTNLDFENITSAILTEYCQEETHTWTLTQNSTYIDFPCVWDSLKLEIQHTSGTYYRVLKDQEPDGKVDWYMIDLDRDTALQVNLQLNDLTSQYQDSTLYILSADGTITILSSEFDLEQKVTAYLISGEKYTIGIGDSIFGYIVADAAGTKTITIPDISFYPSGRLGDGLSWSWSSSKYPIRLIWNDTLDETDSVRFMVYNASGDNALLYSVTTDPGAYTSYSFTGLNGSAYLSCFNASHNVLGELYECHAYAAEGAPIEPDGTVQSTHFWGGFLVVLAVLFAGSMANEAVGIGAALLAFFAVRQLGWMSFGAIVDSVVMVLGIILLVLAIIYEVSRKR